MKQRVLRIASPVLVAATVGGIIWVSAGDLNPPTGPVESTMLRLDEIESRTPISSLPFTIDQCGSYFLTDCLTGAAGQNGITINADDVTLDLNGFSLIGVAGSLAGISVPAAIRNLAVRNGTIRDWGGIGVSANLASNSQLERLRASDNGSFGLFIGLGSLVTHCTARDNSNDGIKVTTACTVQNCSAYANGDDGINTGSGCTVLGCTAVSNTNDGISTSSGCTVRNSTARGNHDDGFALMSGCTISSCTAASNRGDGIQTSGDCRIIGNTCDGNGIIGDGAAIHTAGSNSRIEGNLCTDADRGLDISGSGNYVADNTVKGNTDNYDIAAGNQLNILLCEIPESIDWSATVTLAGSLTGTTGQNGITINADDVTLDLNGFALIGVAGSLDGVAVPADQKNLTVRNGTIRDWGSQGVYATLASNSQLQGLRVSDNGSEGLWIGNGGLVTHCTASGNGGVGVRTGFGCTVVDCSARSNSGHGFTVGPGCSVRSCSSRSNTSDGITAGSGSTVQDCSAYTNSINGISTGVGSTVTNCSAGFNGDDGIVASNSTVTNCSASFNTGDGILVVSDSRIVGNNCDSNGKGGDGAGIHATGSDNRIEGNNVTDNDRGIDTNFGGNIIIRNTASGNTTNYGAIAAGNDVGTIRNTPVGAGPWDNFNF